MKKKLFYVIFLINLLLLTVLCSCGRSSASA